LWGVKLRVREYLTADGRSPYSEWLRELDVATRARVQARVLRFEAGNLGDFKAVGAGVLEARLDFGPGYRIYFGKDGPVVILLLLGGDKSSQRSDIREAQRFWAEYRKATEHGKAK
jgi:putative addiction module killer protein